MFKPGLIIFLLILFHGQIGRSQDINLLRVDSLLSLRGEAYVAIPSSRLKASSAIPGLLMLDRITDSVTYFYVNRHAFDQLKKSGLDFSYVTPPSLSARVRMAKTAKLAQIGEGYPTYQQYLEIMHEFSVLYPSICKIDTIGYSAGGRLLLSARLSAGNYTPGARPALMYTSTMHGDEPAGYVLMLMLIDELLKGYGLNSSYTRLLDETVISINPLANPDGTYARSDSTVFGSTRQNLNMADLNRTFPDWTEGDDPENFPWQTENAAMHQYLKELKPSVSANFHGGAEVVNYPWDAVPEKNADDEWYKYISAEYADTARSIDNTYMDGFPGGITRGYEWYRVDGGRMDYVNYYLHGREVTIELSNAKIPLAENLQHLWLINRRPLINYLKQGLYGIWGTVSDSITGAPLECAVEIPGYDKEYSIVYSGKTAGKFYRYLFEDEYNLLVKADGYVPGQVISLNVENHKRTYVSLKMIPLNSLLDGDNFLIFPNPFNDKFSFLFKTDKSSDCRIEIYNASGVIVFSRVFISSPGINEIITELRHEKPGVYFFKFSDGLKTAVKKIVKA